MPFQVPWKLPSKQPSKPATLNNLTHCAPVQHRPSAHSAPQHHLSPSSISHLPTCGETYLHDHQCGVHSLWSSTTSNPSSIHIIRCLLFLDSRSSLLLSNLPLNLLSKLSNSAPLPPTHCRTPSVLLPRYCGTSPGQPRAVQANPLTTASQTFPLCPTSQDFETSWDLLLISFLRMGNSTPPQPGKY